MGSCNNGDFAMDLKTKYLLFSLQRGQWRTVEDSVCSPVLRDAGRLSSGLGSDTAVGGCRVLERVGVVSECEGHGGLHVRYCPGAH